MIKRILARYWIMGHFPYSKALRSKNQNPKTQVRTKITTARIAATTAAAAAGQ